jgi:enoyl-CoA hydratase/carnithine racemase
VNVWLEPHPSDGRLAVLRVDRPPVNAFAQSMWDRFAAVAAELHEHPAYRAVVITGGPRHFAAGADVTELAGLSPAVFAERNRVLQRAFHALATAPQITVAAISGYALGGGCELALTCDWRVVAEDAKLGQPEIKLGIIPGAGGTQRLARLIGPAKAKDLVFSGRMVDAAEALRIGLADRVVPAAEVYTAAVELVRPYVTGPSMALRAAKLAIDGGLSMDLASGLALESHLFAGLFATEDRLEGTAAFVAKRKPTFIGR